MSSATYVFLDNFILLGVDKTKFDHKNEKYQSMTSLLILTFLALLMGVNPLLARRIVRMASQLAVGADSSDENVLQEILINQLKVCIIHMKIDSAAIYIDPTVFSGEMYKESNLQLLCGYPSLDQNSFINIEDYREDTDNDVDHDIDNEFNRSNYEKQVSIPIEYQSYTLGVLKLIHTDATGDIGNNAFIETLIRSIALIIFNEYKYNKGIVSDSKAKSAIGDAYNALFTSRTLAKMLKKRLMKNDLIGTEMVDNIITQSEFLASMITNIDGNDIRDSDFDVSNRKYIDVEDNDDDNGVILENKIIVEADINTQQIGNDSIGRNKNIFFKQSSSLVNNGTNAVIESNATPSMTTPLPNPNILLVKKTPASNANINSNSKIDKEKSRIIPAEFWSPDKIEKTVNYNETDDNM